MGDPTEKDLAAKQRIISHMNADHQDSLRRYLEHFCHLSQISARKAKLIDITFNSLSIESSKGSPHIVSIDPPLAAWSEARERVVAMDKEALAGLGRSDITVKEYTRPEGFSAVVFVVAAITWVMFSRRANFEPGFRVYDEVLVHVPGFTSFCYRIQPYILSLLVILHGSEAIYMERSRLEVHNVPTFGALWWTWLLSTLVEGFGAFARFDEIVESEKKKKEKSKH